MNCSIIADDPIVPVNPTAGLAEWGSVCADARLGFVDALFKISEVRNGCNFKGKEMGITLGQADDATILKLDGSVDISVAAELKTALVEAIAAGKAVRVSVEAVSELDVTVYQLLWAADRQAKREGIGFTITGQIREAVRETLSAMNLDACGLVQ